MRPLHAKPMLLVASYAWIAGCSHFSATDVAGDGGVAAPDDTTPTDITFTVPAAPTPSEFVFFNSEPEPITVTVPVP